MVEEAPTHESLRPEARWLYGADASGYDAGRPDYPESVYAVLVESCGLQAGVDVVECGPGSGQVTRRLVAAGARVVAVEPDPGMRTFLRQILPAPDVEIIQATFEDAPLARDHFDLMVAATSFHWVDQTVGLNKVMDALRPGGWAAIWWTIFGDPLRPDTFNEVLTELLGRDPGHQAPGSRFQLDEGSRRADLTSAGFENVSSNRIEWTASMSTESTRALYNTMINVRCLPEAERARILDAIESVVDDRFGGFVERPFVTVLYCGQKPWRDNGKRI
ncbi:MAG: class I SAM-dependent methyltransferase [Acidimicrobiales bacterium]